jgi:hypothetical protein
MQELKDIQKYWEANTIYKEAGELSETLKLLGKGFKGIAEFGKDVIVKPLLISAPISAVLAAVAYNKLKSPTVVAKNMDKRLLLNTLDTEIAIARRQIAEMESKAGKKSGDKPYDRFV